MQFSHSSTHVTFKSYLTLSRLLTFPMGRASVAGLLGGSKAKGPRHRQTWNHSLSPPPLLSLFPLFPLPFLMDLSGPRTQISPAVFHLANGRLCNPRGQDFLSVCPKCPSTEAQPHPEVSQSQTVNVLPTSTAWATPTHKWLVPCPCQPELLFLCYVLFPLVLFLDKCTVIRKSSNWRQRKMLILTTSLLLNPYYYNQNEWSHFPPFWKTL